MRRIGHGLALAVACGMLGFAPGAIAQSAGVAIASAAPALTAEQAAERFRQAESFERRRDLRSAFEAYTEAGEAGHPMAQKKLGDFYSAGIVAVPRDYETALKWYQKAREQGVDIPAPPTYPAHPIDAWRR